MTYTKGQLKIIDETVDLFCDIIELNEEERGLMYQLIFDIASEKVGNRKEPKGLVI